MNQEFAPGPARDETHARLFSSTVMQYASTAMMFMGRAPHPETGETVKDLEAAQMFIGQLEMLEAKTKGNLSKPEEAILKQSLMAVRLAFVESVEESAEQPSGEKTMASEAGAAAPVENVPPVANEIGETASTATDDRKKFVKKY